ncbi:MAG: hypothetical protein FJ299_16870, partial [Planctomycetes bacterium]|nr:hypothetical protein [Planctomycetota bacterium]
MRRGPDRLPELLESARAAGSRDPQTLLEDLRCVLGAEELARRVASAARRERAPSAWRRAA